MIDRCANTLPGLLPPNGNGKANLDDLIQWLEEVGNLYVQARLEAVMLPTIYNSVSGHLKAQARKNCKFIEPNP